MRSFRLLIASIGLLVLNPAATRAGDEAPRTPANAPQGVFITKPYLQLGDTPARGTLRLLWHSPDADAEWSVDYQAGSDRRWKKASALSFRRVAVKGIEPHRVYRATLTDLDSGGAFDYRVLKGGEIVFSATAGAPKSAGQPYRFVAFGDCGAGRDEQKPIAYRAFQAKPDLVIIPGDIVYDRGRISEYRNRFWPVYNADEPSLSMGVPLLRSSLFVAAPGNHDIDTRDLDRYPDALAYYLYWDLPLNGPPGTEGSAFVPVLTASDENRRAFVEGTGDAYPRMANFSFDYGNTHWTIVDANPYVDWTNRELKEWVARDLAAAQGATWRFVAFHHPGFNSAREHYEQQQMRLLAPVFEEGKVDIVFNGHVHNYQRSYPMRFKPDNSGTLLVGGRDNKTVRGRVVNGRWSLDKSFDGQNDMTPDGVIYLVTGAGGQDLYNPEQQDDRDSWQGFTHKFVSKIHSLTVADVAGSTLTVRQVTADGDEVDRFVVRK
jgi:3',5'-cyclic AMP phosphodiesterase CpdA